ncbi:M36 family metallopeptidase [Kitasatospora camelliae]|uniref:M36 family metallopeptidase n=1 Tax=Kitasatospora camelliae TaxID=3156397 RepID=A0AAU8JRY3_9ACTN
MTDTIDRRDMSYDHLDSVAGADAFLAGIDQVGARVDQSLTGEPEKVNRFTGHLTELRVDGAPAFADTAAAAGAAEPGAAEPAAASDATYIARAKEYLASVAPAIGFAAGEPAEFVADPGVATTSEDVRVVSLQQTLNGIDVWGMAPKVWLRADGTVERVVGDTVSLPPDLPVRPAVTAEAALRVAAAKAAEPRTLSSPFGTSELPRLDVSGGFRRLAAQGGTNQPMTFSQGPFDEAVPARLVYLYMGGDARLCWRFTLSRDNWTTQYQALVEADDRTANPEAPEILYFQDRAHRVVSGRVFRGDPAESAFDLAPFPLPVSDYPNVETNGGSVPPPAGVPSTWVEITNGTASTVGNNVRALDGVSRQPVTIPLDASGNGVFNDPADSPKQLVTNIFFFCNFARDYFQVLGFDEAHGNFQTVNPSGLGRGGDPVIAVADPREVPGTATMTTRADGLAGMMVMGLVAGTGRHTARSFDVVGHEFTHGVSNRLVGGLFDAEGLEEDQSVAMGEGWSDFFALSIRNSLSTQDRHVVGSWVIDDPAGIRQRPYDSAYPGRFGDIGKGRGQVQGNPDLSYREVHDVGEIWCAALLEVTRRVGAALGDTRRGYRVTWQAVVDGLKLTPKNPSFLTARDAIMRAYKDLRGTKITAAEYPAVRKAAWEAFAQYGMGFDAVSPNASFVGCRSGGALPPAGSED